MNRMRLTPQLLTVSQHLSVDGDQGGGPTYASIVLPEGQRSVATAQVNCLLVEAHHKKSIILTAEIMSLVKVCIIFFATSCHYSVLTCMLQHIMLCITV